MTTLSRRLYEAYANAVLRFFLWLAPEVWDEFDDWDLQLEEDYW